MDWKVHRLIKKKLCHSNNIWHASNSTFLDTNCLVSFNTMSLQWISNSGYWIIVLETFHELPGNGRRTESCFTKDNAPAHTSVTAMAADFHDLAPSDWFLFSNMKTTFISFLHSSKKLATWNPFCPVFRTLGEKGSQKGSLCVQKPKKVPYVTKNGSKEPK